MAWINLENFKASAVPAVVLAKYKSDNAWYNWGDDNKHVEDAWNLYEAAKKSSTKMIILGDKKIRQCPNLILNFGLACTTEPQSEKDRDKVNSLNAYRISLGYKDLNVTAIQNKLDSPFAQYPPIKGEGGILSDEAWSKIMNDCLIVAGLHSGFEFHMAEERVARTEVDKAIFAKFGGKVTPKTTSQAKWLNFFNGMGSDTFWDGVGRCPRVFTREVIGLMTFGYQPEFFDQQLSFSKGTSTTGMTPENANLITYLDALDASGFNKERDPYPLFKAISNYLFGNPEVLKPRMTNVSVN